MRIQNKLFVALLAAGITLVSLMFVAIEWSLTRGLLEFINTKERDTMAPFVQVLKNRYKFNGSWDWVKDRHRVFHDLFRTEVVAKNPDYTPPGPGAGSWGPPTKGHHPPSSTRHDIERSRHGHNTHRERIGSDDGAFDRVPDRALDRPPGRFESDVPPHLGGPAPRRRDRPADMALFDAQRQFVVGKPNAQPDDNWMEIKVDDKVVGFLVIPKRHGITQGYELQLLEQQRFAYVVIAFCLILLTVVIAMPLARNLVLPIKQLARFMNQLTQGKYESRLTLKRNDELGHLSRDVNELAVTLEKNDSARKRWLADISHELRTPIAILKGEMEAVIDGIRPMDIAQMQSSYQEVQRLQRLVDDLHELSSADIGGMKYRKEEFDIVEMLDDEVPQYQHILSRSNITLSTSLQTEEKVVWADGDRLSQLFSNLFVNCAKYAGQDGLVHLSAREAKDKVRITIEDNGPGVPEEHLGHLFEHLFRVDDSRNRKTGGTGLGLAICKQIVEAHQGQIWAEKSPLGGLAVQVELPVV